MIRLSVTKCYSDTTVSIYETLGLLVHIGGICDHLFTSMHCALTVVPIKPDLDDIVTISWKVYLCTSLKTCIPSVRCIDIRVHVISVYNKTNIIPVD